MFFINNLIFDKNQLTFNSPGKLPNPTARLFRQQAAVSGIITHNALNILNSGLIVKINTSVQVFLLKTTSLTSGLQ